MAKKRILTSKYFRLWDTTKEKVYLSAVVLDKITKQYYNTERKIFHLRERLHEGEKGYLTNLESGAYISVLHGVCGNPSIYVEDHAIASFMIKHVNQIDIHNIMAMTPQDIGVVEILAQVDVDITENDIENILNSMDTEDG